MRRAKSRCRSTAASGISVKKSPRQYHWSPGGYTPSKALFQDGSGRAWAPSSSGVPTSRASLNASSAPAGSPVYVQMSAATFWRCSASGNGGPGGTETNANQALTSSGCVGIQLRYQLSSSAASSSDQIIGPATAVACSCSWSVNDVTTPKFPPPPRIAQNRSGFSASLAWASVPSASTTSAPSMLSTERPYLRVRCPTPPPSSSPTPVVEMTPNGVASPNACVAWSMSPIVLPPPTSAVREAGSTRT